MRKFFKWLGIVLSAVCGVIAILLAPAHWQIRKFDSPLPDRADVTALLGITDGPTRLSIVNTASQTTAPGDTLSFPAYVLQWSDGRVFVIDFGVLREDAAESSAFPQMLPGASKIEFHGEIGESLGSALFKVQGAALTHLHMDHAGGIPALCVPGVTTITLYQTEPQARQQNHTTTDGHTQIDRAHCVQRKTLFAADEKLLSIPGFPGLVVYPAAGHTPGSSIFFAAIDEVVWVFSGDISNDKRSLTENRPKSFLYSLLITPEDPERLQQLRRWLGELDAEPAIRVLVSHDLKTVERYGLSIRPDDAGLIDVD